MRASFLIVLSIACLVGVTEAAPNKKSEPPAELMNRGFEQGKLGEWKTLGGGWRISDWVGEGDLTDVYEGKWGLVNEVRAGDKDAWRIVYQTLSAKSGKIYSGSVWIRTSHAENSQSYLEVQFLDSKDEVLESFQSEPVKGSQPFSEAALTQIRAPKKTVSVSVRGVVNMITPPVEGATDYHVFDSFSFKEIE